MDRAFPSAPAGPGDTFDDDNHWEYASMTEMPSLKARVKNGRLVLDEPTDRPEGDVIELVPLDEVLAHGGDYLDDEERERLHRSVERGIDDVKAGRTVDARHVIDELHARTAGR
jgi:hypothetical protein